MAKLPWYAWAVATGLLLSLLLRTAFPTIAGKPNAELEASAAGTKGHVHGHHVYTGTSLADEDGLFTNVALPRRASAMGAASAPAAPPPAPAVPAAKGTLSTPWTGALRSSWHAGEYSLQQSCGGMLTALERSRPMYADRQPVVWKCGCKVSGLGDRLKGVLAAWMLAMVLGRPFLVENGGGFQSMADLEHGVEPSLIDWRTGYAAYTKGPRRNVLRTNRASRMLGNQEAQDYDRPIEVVDQTTPAMVPLVKAFIEKVLGGNGSLLETEYFVGTTKQDFTADDATLISHPFREVYAHAHFCATRALFRPTPKLAGLIDGTLARVTKQFTAEPFVVGIHIRFGGKWKDPVRARDVDAQAIIDCAWNMTRSRSAGVGGSPGALWLLASDNVERLDQLIAGFRAKPDLAPLWEGERISIGIPEGGKVEHVSKSANGTEDASIQRLWHDWFLMSEAHACTLVRSSFPRTACYTSSRRDWARGLVQQSVTKKDLGVYKKQNNNQPYIPTCDAWQLDVS